MPQLLGALQVDRCLFLTNLSICTLSARCQNVHQRQTVQKSRAGVIVFYFQIYRWKIFTKYVPITYLCDQMSHCAYKLWLCDKLKNVSSLSSPPPQSESPQEEELRSTLNSLSAELHKLDDIHWICPLMQCSEEVGAQTACICLCMCLRDNRLY